MAKNRLIKFFLWFLNLYLLLSIPFFLLLGFFYMYDEYERGSYCIYKETGRPPSQGADSIADVCYLDWGHMIFEGAIVTFIQLAIFVLPALFLRWVTTSNSNKVL